MQNGTVISIQEKFKKFLRKNNLGEDIISLIKFEVDSDENVKLNFEGNYFYRLR